MTYLQQELQFLRDVSHNQLGIIFNSEGKVLTRKEMKYHIDRDVINKINFAINELQKQNLPTEKLNLIKNLLIN